MGTVHFETLTYYINIITVKTKNNYLISINFFFNFKTIQWCCHSGPKVRDNGNNYTKLLYFFYIYIINVLLFLKIQLTLTNNFDNHRTQRVVGMESTEKIVSKFVTVLQGAVTGCQGIVEEFVRRNTLERDVTNVNLFFNYNKLFKKCLIIKELFQKCLNEF